MKELNYVHNKNETSCNAAKRVIFEYLSKQKFLGSSEESCII